MAKNQELELSILIGGRVDNSLTKAVQSANSQIASMAKGISNVGKVGLAAIAGLSLGTAKFFDDAIKDAMSYESTMADVAKVVDGLKDSNGNVTADYYTMQTGLKDMTTRVPMTFEEAGEIAASFGQSGVQGVQDILDYTEEAAKMAIAFDSDAEQAGEWMATWKQAFQLPKDEVVNLADQLNYLSNNTNATAQDLAGIVTRVGSLGGMAGVNTSSVAAMADVLVATGVDDDSAATSLRNMFLKWTAGSAATSTEEKVMGKLGLDPVEFAKRMQVDSMGAIKDFFTRISDMPQSQQISLMGQYFGKRAVESATKLAQNLPMLEQNLAWMGEKDKATGQYLWQGSMESEYLTRSGTAENSILLAKNALRNLRESFGEAFLPVVKQGADWLVKFAGKLEENAPLIADLTGQLAELAQGGIEILSGALESLWKVAKKFLDFIHADSGNEERTNGASALAAVGGTAAIFATMAKAPQIVQGVSTVAKLSASGIGPIGMIQNGASEIPKIGNVMQAVRFGAGMAGAAANGTQASGYGFFPAGQTGTPLSRFAQNVQNGVLGGIVGFQNRKQLFSAKSAKGMSKATSGIMTQIADEQANGGLLGMFKRSKVGQYGARVGRSLSNFAGTSVGAIHNIVNTGFVQDTVSLGKQAAQKAGSLFAGLRQSPMMLNSPLGNFLGAAGGRIKGVIGGVTSLPGKAAKGISGIAGSAIGGVKNLAGQFAQTKVGSAVVGGTKNAVQFVGTAAKGVGSVAGAGLNVLTTTVGPIAGKLGGAFMGLMGTFGPIITALGSIVAVVSLLGDHFTDIQQVILKVFGPTGLTIFNTFFAEIKKIGEGIKNAFSPESLANLQTTITSMFGEDAGAAFGGLIQIFESFRGVFNQIIQLGEEHLKPLFEDVFGYVIGELIPQAAPVLSQIISLIGTVLVNAIKVAVDIIQKSLPIVKGVISAIIGVIKGIATVATKVVNTIIRALNKISITLPTSILGIPLPENLAGKTWGFNLSEVPAYANGGFTHGVSIAGEAGTEAVISFKKSVREDNIENWVRAGRMLGVSGEDSARAAGIQKVSYFANGGFTDESKERIRQKAGELIDFSKAYGEYALRSNGIRTVGDAASLLWTVANNSLAGDGSLALAATSIAADVAPIVLQKYLGDNTVTSVLSSAAQTYNGGTVLNSWTDGVLTDTGVPLYVMPPRDTGTQLSEIPQSAYQRTAPGGAGSSGSEQPIQFVFAPNIQGVAEMTLSELEAKMDEMFEKFKREMRDEQRRIERTKYA